MRGTMPWFGQACNQGRKQGWLCLSIVLRVTQRHGLAEPARAQPNAIKGCVFLLCCVQNSALLFPSLLP